MTHQTFEANEILSYALQRRTLITKACEVVETLRLPLDRQPIEPEGAMRSLAYTWAVTVNPDLMRWYRDTAQMVQSRCIHLYLDQGVTAVEPIERLVKRDLKLFTMALDAHAELPAEMQKRIVDLAPQVHVNSEVLSPVRMAAVLPGTLLLAWDRAWRDAIEAFGGHVGDVTQDPAAIDTVHSRIADLEESVQLMLNRFIALGAAVDIPEEYRA